MKDSKVNILVTRPVDASLVRKAREQQIQLDTLSFIETAPIDSIEIQQEIAFAGTALATVIFTSMNAVEAVNRSLDEMMPEWRIYCLGHRTKELVAEYFGEGSIVGTADNATELADEILADDEVEELIFFCGNQRRDELPRKIRAAGMDLNEIPVYETIATPHQLENNYDAVLFFSHTAVESFFSNNKLNESCTLFAIGETTKTTIRKYCKNKIIVSAEPAKDKLVEQAIEYFSS
jgi:uroporphyrinogen-III synthase